MKKLLVLISAVCLMVPALVFATGNPNPALYLEMYSFPGAEPDPIPGYICTCNGPPLNCFANKTAMDYGYVCVHIGKVPFGFLGLPFGMTQTAADIFLGAVACPGFLKGPSTAGEPAAIIVSSTGICYQWEDHPCYVKWLSVSGAVGNLFNIVPSADLLHNMVINCDNLYDAGTTIGTPPVMGDAEWGAAGAGQTILCGFDPTATELTTWGKIKGLYR